MTLPRPLAITLALLVAIFATCLLRYEPPAPRGADAPPTEVSAARARMVQTAITREKRHVGSDGIAHARDFLQAELAKSGFAVELQRARSCGPHGACAFVTNVVAVRAGADPNAKSVVLMAHHDSVPCSSGASDDGGGTSAVVETARAIGAGPPTKRTIVVVLTDAEESGLLGARAFHAQHPLAKSVAGVVNVDSRGGAGPSAMFETSAGNGWLVSELAQHATRPVTSSLFYEIYRRMPNDTDFTALKSDARGLNFANIARIEAYHTPLDSLDHADPGTLQHHAENALAMIRVLANAGPDLEAPFDARADAVWFDVLATFVVRWPVRFTLPLALLALAMLVGQTVRLRAFGRGQLAALGVLAAALAASILMGLALQGIGAIPVPWVAHQGVALAALHASTFATGLGLAIVFARHHAGAPLPLWSGTWLLVALIGVATAVVAPGGAFLFVIPALVAGLTAFAPERHRVVAAIAPVAVAGVLLLPIAGLANDALGLAVPPLACAPTTLLVAMLTPLAVVPSHPARPPILRAMSLLGAASLIALLVAAVAPKFSEEIPQRVNVVVRADHDADDAPPRTTAFVEASWGGFAWGAPPPAMIAALGTTTSPLSAPTPWSSPSPNAPIATLDLPPPIAEVTRTTTGNGRKIAHVVVSSPRGARSMMVSFGVTRSVRITFGGEGGEEASTRNGALLLRAVPPEGVALIIDASGTDAIEMQVIDVTHDLPPSAGPIAGARPSAAVQTQEGDMTVISRRVRL